jgi:GxxExxY protein
MADLIYKDLSYKINGIAFEIDNLIGFGQSEKTYVNAFEKLLSKNNVKYEREKYLPIKIDEEVVAKKYIDLLVDDKIVVEVKTGDYSYKKVCSQTFQYLKSGNYKLGIVIRFTKNGVKLKRIPCFY